MSVEFTSNIVEICNEIEDATIAFLHEAKDSISAQASRNSPVKSGDLKRSFQNDSQVDEKAYEACIGSSLEYAIWQEYGTGEYALEGDGRKGGWVYLDINTGKKVFTRGNKPKRMLYHAFQQKKEKVKNHARDLFGGIG